MYFGAIAICRIRSLAVPDKAVSSSSPGSQLYHADGCTRYRFDIVRGHRSTLFENRMEGR